MVNCLFVLIKIIDCCHVNTDLHNSESLKGQIINIAGHKSLSHFNVEISF